MAEMREARMHYMGCRDCRWCAEICEIFWINMADHPSLYGCDLLLTIRNCCISNCACVSAQAVSDFASNRHHSAQLMAC